MTAPLHAAGAHGTPDRYGAAPHAAAGPAAVEATGHPAVDAAVRAMANTAALPLGEQIAQYEAAHRTLGETLATIDEA
ncbi:hypothetical protein GCM10010123_42190 [Pilimelia anulata]|uniref:Uncharacterized protein n=1 Tax=Pilimelia anulata TaxID=53371 RepID=A0A8J3BFZ8_9ACTN|nr:hypothetical protein [Pilimelia anulata]GGK07807.1 hypothetical protein GCM10010123_42190 [Pilimelia anulata]